MSITPALALLVGLAASSTAYACPVCFAAKNDAARDAFALSTLFLSVLPLGLLGGTVWLLVRRVRRMEDDHDHARSATSRLTAGPGA